MADRNVFIDAYLVLGSENGYKAESRKSSTIYCGFCSDETTTYGGILSLEIVLFPQDMKKTGLWTGAKANLCGVRLLPKQVLDEIADKQKAVRKEVLFALSGLLFACLSSYRNSKML